GRCGRIGPPEVWLHGGEDRRPVREAVERHKDAFAVRHGDEGRRLCYVALARSEHTLLLSGHWWNETSAKPRGPSVFLTELADTLREDPSLGEVAEWAERPAEDEQNPYLAQTREAQWPVDPRADE